MPEQARSGSGTSEIRSGTSFCQIPLLTCQWKMFVLTYSVHKWKILYNDHACGTSTFEIKNLRCADVKWLWESEREKTRCSWITQAVFKWLIFYVDLFTPISYLLYWINACRISLIINLKAAGISFQCDRLNAPLPLPPLITCWIRHPALFRDLEIYKLSTGHET